MSDSAHDDESKAYCYLLGGVFPRVRDCDPKAYYRARFAALKTARDSLLSEEEYQADRQELVDTLTNPPSYPPGVPTILFVSIFVGIAWLVYAFTILESVHFVGGGALTVLGLWMLHGYRTHFAWLRSLSIAQRIDIVEYLHTSNLLTDDDAREIRATLDARHEAK
ncbi:hypothetical protein [Stieleria mannarensis]|uniref:hypothetical protein n=1 Tax=Stieleria mannarensis TaxID=2755585 RepID=UPI0016029085|nr:hypothetical protein [Rhodopirellula sp. JC639]